MNSQERKQQAIKDAYGEHYDICKPDENGWSGTYNEDLFTNPETRDLYQHPLSLDIGRFFHEWRPIVLKGIEYNHDWISVDDRLPDEYGEYWVEIFNEMVNSRTIIRTEFYPSRNKFDTHYEVLNWQPIIVPKPPIY